MNCVFGYGSLISRQSRLKTGDSKKAVPSVLSGFRREWNVASKKSKISFLGIVKDESSECNGVVIEIPDGELVKFDMRERGYDRIELDRKYIKALSGFNLPEGNIWVYVPKKINPPTKEFPIRQSYVDVIISGCLDIDRKFADDFVKTTHNWTVWVDDRKKPSYVRSQSDTDSQKVDTVLKEGLSERFSERKEEVMKSLF